MSRRLKVDESVDAFVADLQRLLGRSGHMLSGDKDAVVIEQLIASLPSDFSKQLRMSLAGKELMISACVEQVRALRSSAADCSVSAGVLEPAAELAAAVVPQQGLRSCICHHCHEVGHIRRHCPKQTEKKQQDVRAARQQKQHCFFCDQPGHLKADCTERHAWLAARQRTSPGSGKSAAVAPEGADPCLCTVN